MVLCHRTEARDTHWTKGLPYSDSITQGGLRLSQVEARHTALAQARLESIDWHADNVQTVSLADRRALASASAAITASLFRFQRTQPDEQLRSA